MLLLTQQRRSNVASPPWQDPTTVSDKSKAADPQAETVEKYGLEAGLWKVFTSKGEAAEGGQGKGAQAKQLLAKYGSAYLITSISFAVVSFAACYALVNAGEPDVDSSRYSIDCQRCLNGVTCLTCAAEVHEFVAHLTYRHGVPAC